MSATDRSLTTGRAAFRHRPHRIAREEDLADEQRHRPADQGVEEARRRWARARLQRGHDEDAGDRCLVDEDRPAPNSNAAPIERADHEHEDEGVGAPGAHDDVGDGDAHRDADLIDGTHGAPAARHAQRDDRRGGGEERVRVQQVRQGPGRAGRHRRLEDPPELAPHASHAAVDRAAHSRHTVGGEGGRALGGLCPPALLVRRLRHDSDAVARRGRDRIVRRQAQIGGERVEVDRAAEAVGAVAAAGEPVTAVGQEVVDRDPVGRRRVDGVPLIVIEAPDRPCCRPARRLHVYVKP